MQALDRVRPGPDVDTQLAQQPNHRSSPLWRCAADEEAPGMIKVRRRKCVLPQGGLDPRIMQHIDAAGLTGLFKVPDMEVDHALITALVERWRPETHTFHLPHGEMGITLQDMEVMLGLPVDGLPVTGKTDYKWSELCEQLLGHKPPPPIPNSNKSTLAGARIRYTWLDAQFAAPLVVDAADEVVQQYARYHLLVRMGALLFMDRSADRVSLLPLQLLNPVSNARRYSWGSAALAWLYRQLCGASKKDAMQIGGALLLVQLWAYSRFPQLCPVVRPPLPPVHSGPLAIRWSGPKCTAEHATHVLAAYRASLATVRAEQIVWEPYTHTLGSLPAYCTAGQHIWRAEVPLIFFWIVEWHHPERVLRQFGMKQPVPSVVDTSTTLHKISLQGKWEKNWEVEHDPFIRQWANRVNVVRGSDLLDDDDTYLVEYMMWYNRHTRRYITPESAYWELMVRTMIRSIPRCDEGSDMHTDLTFTLELVEELGRLKLANALAEAVDIDRQAPVRGRQRGGSRGGGHRGGGQAGRSRTTESAPIYEEGNEEGVEEAWLGTDWVLSDDDGRTPRCMPGDGAGPSHSVDHQGTVPAHTTSHGASTDFEGPPRMSPPVFSGSAHDGGCIFVPTPGMPTPPLVQVDPTMSAPSQTAHGEAVQIEQIPAEDIEPVEALRRSRRPRAHAPDCGTGDGKIRPVRAYGRKRKDH
ncbi:serine/threonine-protein phosphatase 7 long form homolog [Quercus robur]|nr:serine/threonine-protein phosphatase 7 long form homolog [Quercus robur]